MPEYDSNMSRQCDVVGGLSKNQSDKWDETPIQATKDGALYVDEFSYATEIITSGAYTYIGRRPPIPGKTRAQLQATLGWQISRLSSDGSKYFPNCDNSFNFIWDDGAGTTYLTYTYN